MGEIYERKLRRPYAVEHTVAGQLRFWFKDGPMVVLDPPGAKLASEIPAWCRDRNLWAI